MSRTGAPWDGVELTLVPRPPLAGKVGGSAPAGGGLQIVCDVRRRLG